MKIITWSHITHYDVSPNKWETDPRGEIFLLESLPTRTNQRPGERVVQIFTISFHWKCCNSDFPVLEYDFNDSDNFLDVYAMLR